MVDAEEKNAKFAEIQVSIDDIQQRSKDEIKQLNLIWDERIKEAKLSYNNELARISTELSRLRSERSVIFAEIHNSMQGFFRVNFDLPVEKGNLKIILSQLRKRANSVILRNRRLLAENCSLKKLTRYQRMKVRCLAKRLKTLSKKSKQNIGNIGDCKTLSGSLLKRLNKNPDIKLSWPSKAVLSQSLCLKGEQETDYKLKCSNLQISPSPRLGELLLSTPSQFSVLNQPATTKRVKVFPISKFPKEIKAKELFTFERVVKQELDNNANPSVLTHSQTPTNNAQPIIFKDCSESEIFPDSIPEEIGFLLNSLKRKRQLNPSTK